MSNADYSAGLGMGFAVARRANNDLASWIEYARELERAMQDLRHKVLMSHAAMQANERLADLLASKLAEVSPDHELAVLERRRDIRRAFLIENLDRAGIPHNLTEQVLAECRRTPA